jgi:hypothetical protein
MRCSYLVSVISGHGCSRVHGNRKINTGVWFPADILIAKDLVVNVVGGLPKPRVSATRLPH